MEVPSILRVDTEQNVNGVSNGVEKTETGRMDQIDQMDRIDGETKNPSGDRISPNTLGGEMDGEPEQPLAITNGEDIFGVDVNRRRSTRMRKEPVPLIREMPFPSPSNSKSSGTFKPKYRPFRPPSRVYKPSALVDRNWSMQEREKLLDAVSKVAIDDYASIADIIGNTRSPAEVRDYLKRIQARSKELEGHRYSALFDEKRHPHSRHLLVKEEGQAIERWLRVIDHLVSDNDTADFSKVIPDVFAVIANLEQNPDPGTIKVKRKKQEDGDSSISPGKVGEDNVEENEDDEDDDSVAPINFKVIYEYLYALLRGLTPPSLDPIESWVLLDLISDTASELKGSDLEVQKEYLRCIYRDYCFKTVNMKWCNTSRMVVPITEEIAVVSKRRKMEATFSGYLSKAERERDGTAATDNASAGGTGGPSTSCPKAPDLSSTSETRTSPSVSSSSPAASSPAASSPAASNPAASSPSLPRTSSSNDASTTRTSSSNDASTTASETESKTDITNGEEAEIHPLANFIKDDPTYHNIMIGGLQVAKDAEDLGSFFTLNPLGVPTSILNPKLGP